MINDSEILKEVKPKIENENENAAYAYQTVTNQYITIFETMEDAYFKERAADIKDIQYRVLSTLLNVPLRDLSVINEPVIIVAEDLTPSDTAMLNLEYVKGFATEVGGQTSHTAIMARALNIPAMVGVSGLTEKVQQNDQLILDALDGIVTVNPSQTESTKAEKKRKNHLTYLERLSVYKDQKTQTEDGHHVGLYANIGSSKDLIGVKASGAEGVGLFRTEFLFMDTQSMPSLEIQIKHYEEVFNSIQPVIVRTLDIGGDKSLPYLKQDKEDNPFLGHRAIRLCFEHLDLFKTQLKALLIAAKDQKDVRVMIPMIARVDEVIRTKAILEAVKQELDEASTKYQKNIKLGIMIEIPSAALNIPTLAKHIDFISIGSNDLIQYLYAADRMNPKVSYLYEPYDPTLLRLLNTIISEAKNASIETGLCGEIGSNKDIALLLIAMEIDEISMSANSILEVREALSKVKYETLQELLKNVLKKESANQVKAALKAFNEEYSL